MLLSTCRQVQIFLALVQTKIFAFSLSQIYDVAKTAKKKKHLLKQTKHWDKPVLQIWMVAIIDIEALKT